MSTGTPKSILLVIAHNNFRDEEYASVRNKLQSVGATIAVASTTMEIALGSQGAKVNPDLLIDAVDPDQYDGVIFIGGTGASQYWHDSKAHAIVAALNARQKLVAACSHAPVTLAVTGILKGKKATAHVSVYEKLCVQGAEYTGKKLEVDGNIITSAGVSAAREFSEAVAKIITANS
jgi:protease I